MTYSLIVIRRLSTEPFYSLEIGKERAFWKRARIGNRSYLEFSTYLNFTVTVLLSLLFSLIYTINITIARGTRSPALMSIRLTRESRP